MTNIVSHVTCVYALKFHVCEHGILIHGNQHPPLPKIYKKQKFKNKMEGDTDDSTVQGSKDREILKGIQRKTLIDTECENNINTGAEELVSSENVL